MKTPMGLMSRSAGEEIGEMIGEVIAIGEFLRIKVCLDIRKPLMWGVMLDLGDCGGEKTRWCPLSYEFLPNFCYMCGLIGHTNSQCVTQLKKKEKSRSFLELSSLFRRRGD
jgi:hypothetical protein